jgi:3-hydroxy-3-methylglutaryl CoA synthase
MFSDTITITVNAIAKVLTRINQDKYSSEYLLKDTDSEFRLRIRNSSYTDKTRGVVVDRHNVELVQTVYAAVAGGPNTIRKAYVVTENDFRDGITSAVKFDASLMAFLTEGNLTKLVNWES